MTTIQTREQMLAARSIADRAAISKLANRKPTVSASRVNGGLKMVIVNPTQDMRATMTEHGFALETDLANTYARICVTPEDLAVVQNAVRGFFGR